MSKPDTFILNIQMKGVDKKALRAALEGILKEFDTPYGKPCQGIVSQYHVETKVSTPIWDGKEY